MISGFRKYWYNKIYLEQIIKYSKSAENVCILCALKVFKKGNGKTV